MAHSFVEAHDNETAAFETFAHARPENLTLLIDTYDTEAAARKVVALVPRLQSAGIVVRGVRLDSGNLSALSRSVRRILDDGGLRDVTIFASGGLDEFTITSLVASGAPIDGFGVGTSLTTSSDHPALDCAYKLQEYAGLPRRKHSPGKETWPGTKQVFRRYDAYGRMAEDVLTTADDEQPGEPLLQQTMAGGRRFAPSPTLAEIRDRARFALGRLPDQLRQLQTDPPYPVRVGDRLVGLAEETDERLAKSEERP
jgi:nicotinate phosphoribosyltransferase